MSKKPAVHFRGLIGCLVGVAFLGACAGPEQDGAEQANRPVVVDSQAQDLRDVTVLLSVGKTAVSMSESAMVTVTLRNDGRHAVKLLRWHTPAEGLEEPLFEVTRDGAQVAFEGPHYKRPAPTEADYVRLAPGESLTRTVDLQGVYDLSKSGTYRVRFAFGEASGPVRQLASNEVSLFIEGRANPMLADKGVSATVTGAISFNRCDTTQQSTVIQAINAASAMADNSNTYLTTTTPGATARYTTWFGAYSSANWSTAKTHFAAIKDAFDTKPITVDCGCKQSYYAYVYPTKPYVIYVCKAFWAAPMTGTDSKGGTLIHEMSHFNVVVGTDDHVYGQSGAKNLALTNPTNALDNADNHEYFAENTPFLQ
jgi:peptidyl-Lys metalloendopeptidase